MTYKQRASRCWAHFRLLLAFLTSQRSFVQLHTDYSIAAAIKAPSILAQYQAGAWPDDKFLEDQASAARATLKKVRREFWGFGFALAVMAACALGFNCYFGRVVPSWPADGGKLLSAIGGALVAWVTMFQLGTESTWGEDSPDETLRLNLFKIVFSMGAVLALAGALW